MRQSLINTITGIGNFFIDLSNGILDVLSFIVSILGFIRYAGKTLVVGVYRLFMYILNSGVFVNVSEAFLNLSDYIGIGAYFIYALLFLIIVRIIVAFGFKIFRLNLDYEMRKTNWAKGREQTWEKHVAEAEGEFAEGRHIFHG